jgi:hypothetical protein
MIRTPSNQIRKARPENLFTSSTVPKPKKGKGK